MQFLDPTNDFVFKRIFGNEKKKEILISFLNSILRLRGEREINDVTLLNPTQAPHIKGAKETILDVRCHDQRGNNYIVEMQVLGQAFFDKRVLYYVSKAYSNQLDKGEGYHTLTPVIFLGILQFNFTQSSRCISTHMIHDIETKEQVFRDFRFTLAELPKFNKSEEALESIEDKWLYFLKQAKQLTAIPAIIQEQAIKDAFDIANESNWDKKELEMYEKRAMYVQDEAQRVNFGYQKGIKQGIEKGIEKGKVEGKAEGIKEGIEQGKIEGIGQGKEKGIKEGIEQGKAEGKLATAKNMLTMGLSIEQAAQATGLSEEVIKNAT